MTKKTGEIEWGSAVDRFVNHGCDFVRYALLYRKPMEGAKKVLRAGRTISCDNAGQCVLSSLEALNVSVGDTEKSGIGVVKPRTNY